MTIEEQECVVCMDIDMTVLMSAKKHMKTLRRIGWVRKNSEMHKQM